MRTHAESRAMIRVFRHYRKCGEKFFYDAPRGLRTACVVETALGILPDVPVPGVGDSGNVDELSRENARATSDLKEPVRAATMLGELGDYELLDEIVRGGQGVVFRARQKNLNRIVALKVISLGQWANKAHLKRFRLEAEAAARLEHPGIVPIHEVGEGDGSCYFSMKFIEGGKLDASPKREPIPIRHAAELIAKVARTVHYAHEHGILHRDIKPGNILLDAKGEPHLTDFGLARLVESESSVTHTLDILGTPSYMAPEQAVGNNTAVSHATDVYGIGAVLYQLLTGHPPFAGGATYETIRLLLDTEPRQPRLLNPKIDRDLSTICLKCLEKDPKRRYSSALALAEDLEHWLKHEPIQARRTGIFARGKKWVRRNPSRALLAASLVALAAAAGWIVWKSEFIRHPVTNGVAVLPFENLSPDSDNAYFADGIQEEILTRLASVADLKVISRTSTQQYQSKPRNLREIAKQLGVAHIVEGSVQKAADQVRVNVQLINALTDAHLWADTYDRKLTDIFAVESEIAKTIADTLQARLTGSEKTEMSKKPTEDPEAYEFYLKGRFFWNKRTSADLRKAIEYFNQAVARDSNYALAYVGLSDSYLLLPNYGSTSSQEALPPARTAARKALALDDSLAEAHASLGLLATIELDLERALSELERAVQLKPNYATGHHWLALADMTLARFDRAIGEGKRAIELDPLSVIINADFSWLYLCARRYDEAEAQARKTLEIDPHFFLAHYYLGIALQLKGRLNEAIPEFQKSSDLNGDPYSLGILGQAYAHNGQTEEARKILARLNEHRNAQRVAPYAMALVYLGLGDKERAMDELDRGYRDGETNYLFVIKVDPLLDDLRGDARFEALVQKITNGKR